MICWVITGAGHFLRETVALLEEDMLGRDIDVWLTKAAVEVAARYLVLDRLKSSSHGILYETGASSQGIVGFASGRYDLLVISPATSNTVAKCALGIADSLASTFFSQADKCGVRSIFLPTDCEGDITSISPSGKTINIRARAIDLRHVDDLGAFDGVTIVRDIDGLKDELA